MFRGIIRALGDSRGNLTPFSAYIASRINLNFDMEVGIVIEQHYGINRALGDGRGDLTPSPASGI